MLLRLGALETLIVRLMTIERVAESLSNKLLAALEVSDSDSRGKRASRIEWMGQFSLSQWIIEGRVETLRLLSESKNCFIDGHFIATLVLSMGFIEHVLVIMLSSKGLSSHSPGIAGKLSLARSHNMVPNELLDRTDVLQKRRNPFIHMKSPSHEHSLSFRYINERRHPDAILQEDAEESLHLAHLFFHHLKNTT